MKKIIEFTKYWKHRNLLHVVEISHEWYVSEKEVQFLDENENHKTLVEIQTELYNQ